MKKFAVFDIDGTLIRWQLYHAVVDKLAKKDFLSEKGRQEIHQARMKWKRREENNGFSVYERTLIKAYEQALSAIHTADFDATVQEVIDEYKDQTYTYTRNLIHTLKADDYVLLAISGSQDELVSRLTQYYGFDDYIATIYHRDKTRFTGSVHVASHDKKGALTSLIKKHSLTLKDSYAVGDSRSDAAMLEMVEHPIAFNPDKELFNRAREAGWKVVLERKNMVYELEKNGEDYILAETN